MPYDEARMTKYPSIFRGPLGISGCEFLRRWCLVIWHWVLRCAGHAFLLLACACSPARENEVVVYTSQDQVYAEPIFKSFEAEMGIRVKAVFDTESVKTAGLANRLRFERNNPQCDLFWNNEEMHTRFLAKENLFRPPATTQTENWAYLGYRTRRMVINTNALTLAAAPKSLLELTNSTWRGRVVLAYPLFGTTAYQFLALRQFWGDAKWKSWCRALAANGAKVVDGNSMVVKLVAKGEAQIGLTDWDDVASGQEQRFPVSALAISDETLAIPNTVALVRNSPHPKNAERLRAYLLRDDVRQKLHDIGAIEGTDFEGIRAKTLKMDWNSALANFDEASLFLKEVFLR